MGVAQLGTEIDTATFVNTRLRSVAPAGGDAPGALGPKAGGIPPFLVTSGANFANMFPGSLSVLVDDG